MPINIEDLIAQIQSLSRSRLPRSPQQRPGGGFSDSGLGGDYNSPGAISNWLWSQGYSGLGPSASNAPPIVRQTLQQKGMQLDPTQYRTVGGFTPQFASSLNEQLYPGMRFQTGKQSMGELIGPKMQPNYEHPYQAFSRTEYDQLQTLLHSKNIDEDTKKQILDEYLAGGGGTY